MEGRQGGCEGGDTICSAVGTLLFIGNEEIREWVEGQEAFMRSIEAGEEGIFALEELLSKKGSFDRVTSS